MNQLQAFDIITNAMTTQKKGDETICVYKDDLPQEIKEKLYSDIQYKIADDTGASYNLSYEIIDRALSEISEATFDGLDNDYYNSEFASVYTATQLSWLNINNQSEISDIAKEYDIDIAQAAAVWFDNAVRSAIAEIVDYIKSFEEN